MSVGVAWQLGRDGHGVNRGGRALADKSVLPHAAALRPRCQRSGRPETGGFNRTGLGAGSEACAFGRISETPHLSGARRQVADAAIAIATDRRCPHIEPTASGSVRSTMSGKGVGEKLRKIQYERRRHPKEIPDDLLAEHLAGIVAAVPP